jgi:hypothetical protein
MHEAHMTQQFESFPRQSDPADTVKQHAAEIINRLDGSGDFQKWMLGNPEYDSARAKQVREMLIKDSQTLSARDMKELINLVRSGENKQIGYDLEIYGHSQADIAEKTRQIAAERNTLFETMKNCNPEERRRALAEFVKEKAEELENYKKEMVLELTHYAHPAAPGQAARSPGAPIEVAAFRMVNGLPDFQIVDSNKH